MKTVKYQQNIKIERRGEEGRGGESELILFYDAVRVFVAGQSDLQLAAASPVCPALALTARAGAFLEENFLTERALIAHPAPSVLPLQSVLAPRACLGLGSDCWHVYQVLDISQLLFLSKIVSTLLTGRGRGERTAGAGAVERGRGGGGGGGGGGGHLVIQL